MGAARVVVVDHHDSYTWNLVHLVAAVTGALPDVVQHDEVDPDRLLEGLGRRWTHAVLSPGPGSPDDEGDFSVGRSVLEAARVPVLGVCLGMQGMVSVYGGRVDRVAPAHGVVAQVRHADHPMYAGDPTPFDAVRYHSLAALDVPLALEVTAWCDGLDRAAGVAAPVVMGVAHRERPQWGVQYHPESVLSECGEALVRRFLALA